MSDLMGCRGIDDSIWRGRHGIARDPETSSETVAWEAQLKSHVRVA